MSAVLEKQAPREFNLALRVDETINKELQEGSGLVAVAEACDIDCHDMVTVAKGNLDGVIAFRRTLEERRKRFIEPAKQIVEEANALFKPAIEAAERAELIYRQRLGAWQLSEQRRIEDARKRAQEEDRRLREVAERAAAAARAKAEQGAQEARKRAEDAERARLKAEAEGNTRAAAAAAAARGKAEEEERQKREAAEREAERIRMEAAAAQGARVLPQAQKVDGLTSRDCWVAERTAETAEQAIAMVAAALCTNRPDLVAILEINQSALDKLAKALKASMNVPGFQALNRPVTVNRRK